ncbi:hypothetical protein DLAC_02375 [Tieghemostelium lacteum]|uniref:NmrA-like domain-containing protein n=1 Tax=Tieghemostelium lacteum TaxID=361077 RepID=A0A152A5A9_TIELA|nr:hypothetical protein DLAC_02375 [Tieghemostelium lacteum]|eukprot:KYR01255.1 hypothetical protein DLAC_02375 [Tieghemostelium lacteum]
MCLNHKPVFVVTQVFSKQGSSIVNTLLEEGKYKVRGITSRSLDSEEAKQLQARGVELVQADYLNKDQLLPALKGAYGLFVVRPLISPVEPGVDEKEFQSIKTQCDAAVESGTIQHLIYSSTDSPAADRVQTYVNATSIPTVSTFYLAFFFSNVIEFSRPLQQGDSLVFAQPFPEDLKIPYTNPYTTTGPVVSEFLSNPTKYNRAQIPVVGEFLTGKEFAETFKNVSGVNATYKAQNKEQYLEDNGFNANPQMQYVGNIIYEIWSGSGINPKAFKNATTEFTNNLNIKSKTFKEFLQASKWRGEPWQDFKSKLSTYIMVESKIDKIVFNGNGKVEITRTFLKVNGNQIIGLKEDNILDESSVLSVTDSKQTRQPIIRTLNPINFPQTSHLLKAIRFDMTDGRSLAGSAINQKQNRYLYQTSFESKQTVYNMVSEKVPGQFIKLVELKDRSKTTTVDLPDLNSKTENVFLDMMPLQKQVKIQNASGVSISSEEDKSQQSGPFIQDIVSLDPYYNEMINYSLIIEVFGDGERDVQITYQYTSTELQARFFKKINFEDQPSSSNSSNNNNTASLDSNSKGLVKITQKVTFNALYDFENIPVEFHFGKIKFSVPSLSCNKLTTCSLVLTQDTFSARGGYISLSGDNHSPSLVECILFDNLSTTTIMIGGFSNNLDFAIRSPVLPGQLGIISYIKEAPNTHRLKQKMPKTRNNNNNNKMASSFFSKVSSNSYSSRDDEKGPYELLTSRLEELMENARVSSSICILTYQTLHHQTFRYLNFTDQDMEIVFLFNGYNLYTFHSTSLNKYNEGKVPEDGIAGEDEDDDSKVYYQAFIKSNSIFTFVVTLSTETKQTFQYGPSEFLEQVIRNNKYQRSTNPNALDNFDFSGKNIPHKEIFESMENKPKPSHKVYPTVTSMSNTSVSNSSSSSNSKEHSSSWFSRK